MKARPLTPTEPVTIKGDRPSTELLVVIQMLVEKVQELERRVAALEGQVAALDGRLVALEGP